MRAAERDLRRLLRRALRDGYTLERGRGGHWHLRDPDGRLVCAVGFSPSCSRNRRNTIRDLRSAGVPL